MATRVELKAYLAWARAAGPFWQYVAAMPFYGPLRRRPIPGPLDAAEQAIRETILPFFAALSDRVALLVDLPLTLGLAATPAFHGAGWLVVPAIYRWPAGRAILPAEDALAQLVWHAARLRPPAQPRGAAFILDGGRLGAPKVAPLPLDRLFDNRYAYPVDTLPQPAILRQWGATVVAVAAHEHHLPADVQYYAARLEQAGIAVSRIWVPLPAK